MLFRPLFVELPEERLRDLRQEAFEQALQKWALARLRRKSEITMVVYRARRAGDTAVLAQELRFFRSLKRQRMLTEEEFMKLDALECDAALNPAPKPASGLRSWIERLGSPWSSFVGLLARSGPAGVVRARGTIGSTGRSGPERSGGGSS